MVQKTSETIQKTMKQLQIIANAQAIAPFHSYFSIEGYDNIMSHFDVAIVQAGYEPATRQNGVASAISGSSFSPDSGMPPIGIV